MIKWITSMVNTFVWVLTFSVLGPTPEYKELAKFNTKEECMQALEQKRIEYKDKKLKIAGSCHLSTKAKSLY